MQDKAQSPLAVLQQEQLAALEHQHVQVQLPVTLQSSEEPSRIHKRLEMRENLSGYPELRVEAPPSDPNTTHEDRISELKKPATLERVPLASRRLPGLTELIHSIKLTSQDGSDQVFDSPPLLLPHAGSNCLQTRTLYAQLPTLPGIKAFERFAGVATLRPPPRMQDASMRVITEVAPELHCPSAPSESNCKDFDGLDVLSEIATRRLDEMKSTYSTPVECLDVASSWQDKVREALRDLYPSGAKTSSFPPTPPPTPSLPSFHK
jgi:hypothetical protein